MNEHDMLKEALFKEVHEIFEALDVMLLDLEKNPTDIELLNSIFRNVHTLKGSWGLYGYKMLERFTHLQEDLLDCMRSGEIPTTSEKIDLLFECFDFTKDAYEKIEAGAETDSGALVELEERIKFVLPDREGEVEEALEKKATSDTGIEEDFIKTIKKDYIEAVTSLVDDGNRLYQIEIRLGTDSMKMGVDPMSLLRRLANDGEIIITHSTHKDIPPLEDLDIAILYFDKFRILYASKMGLDEISNIFEFALDAGSITAHQFTPKDLKEYFDIDADPFWIEAGEEVNKDGVKEVKGSLVDTNDEGSDDATQIKGEKEAEESSAIAAARAKLNSHSQTALKIDAEKLDNLVDMIGELVIAQSLVTQDPAIKGLADSKVDKNIAQLTKITNDIQDMAMGMRMLPLTQTFRKMSRVARDVSKKLDKEIDFTFSGEDTEVDKSIIDEIGDPLIHLIRNAVDHGIEGAEDRARAGKPPAGKVELNAFHQGGNIVVEIKDDGRGLSREAIVRRGVEQGLLASEADMTDNHLYNLIFEPGFSTAGTTTNISGRGVGLDVVKKNVEKLRGRVDISTELGAGTTISIKLPLTLAIIEGMLVRVGVEKYIIPTLSIESSFRPSSNDVTKIEDKGEVVNIREQLHSIVRLHKIYNTGAEKTDPHEAILILVESEGRRCCLMVDEIIGHEHIVIKSLGDNFRGLKGVSGCTILGDGNVGLILDVSGILDIAVG